MSLSSRPIPAALRPPPNTPLTPTFPSSLAPFTSSLPTSYEDTSSSDHENDDEDEDPFTIASYGLLTPSESYLPPPASPSSSASPLSSSPKRYPHGCLRLRPPMCRPPLPKHTGSGTFGGSEHGGWSCPRVVVGGGDSGPSSPMTPTPTSRTKPIYPGYLRSSSSPSSPTASRSSPCPNSPAPLPILLRPLPLTHFASQSTSNPPPAHL